MKHLGTKILETKRLILRKFSLNDCEDFYNNWASDGRVTKYVTWDTHKDIELTKLLVKEWIECYKESNYYQWIIELKEIKQAIGSISVVRINEEKKEMEIGYCIGYDYWNHGYTTEAFQKVIDFLFNEVDVDKIVARHDSRNIGSGKVMEKCGMKFVGTMEDTNKGENIILKLYEIKKTCYNL